MATSSGNKYDCEACPDDCTQPTLPVVQSTDCIEAEEEHLSEICELYLTSGYTFTDVNDPAEWATVLSNTATTGTFIRKLNVIGDKPLGTPTTITKSKNRTKTTFYTWVYNLTIDDTNDTNYEFIRTLQACGGEYCAWVGTLGCKLYGGNTGILVTVTTADTANNRGAESVETFELVLTFKGKCLPPRTTNPIA